MLKNFWWSTSLNDRRGVSWLSWAGMSMSKTKGGLGFRSLYGFYIALIGKLCWNFIKNPQSLVARVYKARYFPTTNILKADAKAGFSYIQRGIITAKDMISEGFR